MLWALVLFGVLFVVFRAVMWVSAEHRAVVARRRAEALAVVARADRQHAWVLAGDPRGVFGEYRPVDI
ncbi:hypothetical protein HWC44_gp043 [Mycobacterium phage ThetaBob]|uniref:Uncharacterized protein n=1 Tax=Mycobacterium phage ThetaBob TaxID=2588513 RepID=A0A4Y6EMK2_9CAUD|nr:hypothetical protein HWC44_gp043 [Mycobacterium phage ThetaBob]QDF19930.1 hypothetical protein SEA_THETABOB_43 [Mycobacterium phage ThetaBob]